MCGSWKHNCNDCWIGYLFHANSCTLWTCLAKNKVEARKWHVVDHHFSLFMQQFYIMICSSDHVSMCVCKYIVTLLNHLKHIHKKLFKVIKQKNIIFFLDNKYSLYFKFYDILGKITKIKKYTYCIQKMMFFSLYTKMIFYL